MHASLLIYCYIIQSNSKANNYCIFKVVLELKQRCEVLQQL